MGRMAELAHEMSQQEQGDDGYFEQVAHDVLCELRGMISSKLFAQVAKELGVEPEPLPPSPYKHTFDDDEPAPF